MRQPGKGGEASPESDGAHLKVTRTYLEMRDPSAHHRAALEESAARIARVEQCTAAHYLWLYDSVGREYHWRDRITWSDEQVAAHLAQPAISLWELKVGGLPAGYFELASHDDGSVELAYFGLLGAFIGRGLGKALLSRAVDEAWALGANRVWLHTCTLDNPAALPNYKQRGFAPYKTEEYEIEG